MAERLLRREGSGCHATRSAGSKPGVAGHPLVIEALHEIGIDASDHVPRKLDEEALGWADVVVATCDDACPVVPGKKYVAWNLPDPKNQPIERVREIRDEIARRVHQSTSSTTTPASILSEPADLKTPIRDLGYTVLCRAVIAWRRFTACGPYEARGTIRPQ